MKFSFNWLKEYLSIDLSPEELAELLTLYSFETEVAGKKQQDYILDIDILPNRFADSASHFGVAREIKALLTVLGKKNLNLKEPAKKKIDKSQAEFDIQIKNKELCPRYAGVVMRNVKVGPSPKWLKDRLAVCGVGSINNIVDITNFVMLELGQPIHAFDFDKIAQKKIIVRQAQDGEKIQLLDGSKAELSSNNLVIADQEGTLALAGIKGGKKAELGKKTKNIFLEVAHFDRKTTFLSAKELGIDSDAARRFSSGLDINLVSEGLTRGAHLIEEIAGGKTDSWKDVAFIENFQEKIKLEFSKTERLIGGKISSQEIKKILKALDCEVKSSSDKELTIIPPVFRKDLNIQEDLIEEIARLKGYMNLEAQLPNLPLAPVERGSEEIYESQIKDIFKGAGFSESYNYTLTSEKLLKMTGDDDWVKLANPISKRFSSLRSSLLPGLLVNISENLKYHDSVRLFEVGKVFYKQDNMIEEKNQLGLVISGKEGAFFELKGVLELVFKGLGISNYLFEVLEDKEGFKEFCPDPLAEIKIDEQKIGCIGKITPQILGKLKIDKLVVAAYLDLDKLFKFAQEEFEYQPPSKYPAVLRDIAILVDQKVRFSEILNVIDDVDTNLIQDVDVFDIYEGSKLPSGKKSLAFHITYQSYDHTLTDKEVNQEHRKVEQALEKKVGATVR